MNKRTFLKALTGLASLGTTTAWATSKPKAPTDSVLVLANDNSIMAGTGLTHDEYKAITAKILALHDDVYRMDWELGLITPAGSHTYGEDVRYNGNYYWTNYRIEEPEGQNKRIVLQSVGKSHIRFYDPTPITEPEQQAIKAYMKRFLSAGDIRWDIPGSKNNVDTIEVLDQFTVTFKSHPRGARDNRIVYIEAVRMVKPS